MHTLIGDEKSFVALAGWSLVMCTLWDMRCHFSLLLESRDAHMKKRLYEMTKFSR